MNYLQITLFVFCLQSTFLNAQNLVKNPSFEKITSVSFKELHPYGGSKNFKYNLMHWRSVNDASPDIFGLNRKMHDRCKDYNSDCHTEINGKVFAGIVVYGSSFKEENYREYIEVKLKSPLQINETYQVSFYTTKYFPSKAYVNNLGFLFSKKSISAKGLSNLDLKPHYAYKEIIDTKPEDWQLVETEFKADKAYQYLILGNFFDNKSTKSTDEFKEQTEQVLYLIDFVKVSLHKEEEEKVVENLEEVIPNKIEKLVLEQEIIEPIKPIYIYFDTNKKIITEEEKAKLQLILNQLFLDAQTRLVIIGHTDDIGTFNYNLNLSKNRSEQTELFFIENGISKNRIYKRFESEQKPIASNQTETGKQQNRRVEIILLNY